MTQPVASLSCWAKAAEFRVDSLVQGVTLSVIMDAQQQDLFNRRYELRWDEFETIIRGKSAIDINHGFHLKNLADVDRFIKSYGYQLDHPIESAEAFGNFHEALNFIRKYFLQPENPDGIKAEIPRKILELTDVRDLFLLASLAYPGQTSDTQGTLLRNFACSTLKVMHTIAHMDQDIRASHFADIQKQVFDRFYRMIQRDSEGKLFLGEKPDDPMRVDLHAFETKPKKSRDSTLLKLLHKPENSAEEIFDRVGIRFVTHNRIDTLRVIWFLKERMVLLSPNIKPSRSRNSLINLEGLEQTWDQWLKRRPEYATDQEWVAAVEASVGAPQSQDNPHSSRFYRAIQFTARQLVKQKNPIFDELKELKAKAKARSVDSPDDDLVKMVDRMELKNVQREVRFFYPYEVQLVDFQSFEENEKGKSAHSEYKKSQLQTAMKRVMGPLM